MGELTDLITPLLGDRGEARSIATQTLHATEPGPDIDSNRLLKVAARREALHRLARRTSVEAPELCPPIIGESARIRELRDFIPLVASTDLSVLVTGESGTGKELVARAIHATSARYGLPLVSINAAALPEGLLESEMFGRAKGAFSGATTDAPGVFEAADGGTLFLDEIGDLGLPLQPKLLRALESGLIRRLGTVQARSVDVRLIAATNSDLESKVRTGLFRRDLLWRIQDVRIHVSPLRERPDDISILATSFAAGTPVSPEAMRLLKEYTWPGNVRELRSVIQSASRLSLGKPVTPDNLPPQVRYGSVPEAGGGPEDLDCLPRDLRMQILALVEESGGSRARASEILSTGLDRSVTAPTDAHRTAPSSGRYRAPSKPAEEERRIRAALRASGGRIGAAAKILKMSRQTLWRRRKRYGILNGSDS